MLHLMDYWVLKLKLQMLKLCEDLIAAKDKLDEVKTMLTEVLTNLEKRLRLMMLRWIHLLQKLLKCGLLWKSTR